MKKFSEKDIILEEKRHEYGGIRMCMRIVLIEAIEDLTAGINEVFEIDGDEIIGYKNARREVVKRANELIQNLS